MPLESTMICLDNSEWMRNGDYAPSRLESMQDAANLVAGAKLQSNPENSVGVMSLAGKGPEVLVSPTDDMGKILNSIHDLQTMGRQPSLSDGVQVAALALKHRRNKNGGQRIVIFVGSPIDDESKALVKAAKQLKKNNIAVDVVNFGEIDANQAKLEEFINTVNSDSNSNLVSIPPGCVPSDVLVTSPIINEHMAGGGVSSGATDGGAVPGQTDFAEFGGVDPNLDPELAMALRVSMEEERAQQEREAARKATAEAQSSDAPTQAASGSMELEAPASDVPVAATSTPASAPPEALGNATAMNDDGEDDEEELLRQVYHSCLGMRVMCHRA